MKSRTRSRKPASIGSNHSSRRPTAISASEPRTGNFVLLLVMAWSPPAHNAGIVWVSAPGDYATFNSNHTPDGTWWELDSNYRFRASGVTVLSLRLSPQVPSFSSGAVRGHHARDRRRHAAGRTRSPLRLAVTGLSCSGALEGT